MQITPSPLRTRHVLAASAAIVGLLPAVRRGLALDQVYETATLLRPDTHDLIHKAVGWMLREVGNRSPKAERAWLESRYPRMPRTMLRYAIEKFPEAERRRYLAGTI